MEHDYRENRTENFDEDSDIRADSPKTVQTGVMRRPTQRRMKMGELLYSEASYQD
jgi:hypothetical protein